MSKKNLVVVSNRLPVTVTKENGKLKFTASPGGLATAMSSVKTEEDMQWVGWPGIIAEDLTAAEKREITDRLKEYNSTPVFLTADQIENFYEGYSNETLWPLFHYFQSLAQYSEQHWRVYKEVNRLYAKSVKKMAAKDSTIWVHDYHLTLVPRELRIALPHSSIGFFLHIPFPSFEIFRLLPHRKEILEGILGADLVGFHIYDYVRHFVSSVMRTLGYESRNGVINYHSRDVRADAFPIGIDYTKFQRGIASSEVKEEVDILNQHYKNKKVILSVDRLDYSKGIAQRLEAFERFLKKNPQRLGKVSLVMIAVPSRTEVNAYKDLRDQIEQTVSRINGRYATTEWIPVAYQFQNLPFEKLIALYAKADVALVTPVRDGMNLVAKEYVASKTDTPGVLILSELAGAADELPEALIVNPNDSHSIVIAIEKALAMPLRQQKVRLAAMQRRISSYDVQKWANDFLDQLQESKLEQTASKRKLLNSDDVDYIINSSKKAARRLIVLDYDGTLKPFVKSPRPSAASPSQELLKVLSKLSKKATTDVYVISGRTREALQQWFGELPVKLVAEHGYWIKDNGKWINREVNTEGYKRLVLPLMIKYTERTPSAVIEDKSSSLVWHYRNVNPEMAYARKRNLKRDLSEVLSGSGAGVFSGHKILEVKPESVNKGVIVQEILNKNGFDFLLCAGDDYTDEDMFSSLPASDTIFSIKVGLGETAAQYQVLTAEDLLSLLQKLTY